MAEKILIVDDDAEFRSEFRDALSGYQVIEASSGRECLQLLKRANEVALVILDVMMPGLSGIDVLVEIRKTDPGLGIIILTGYSSKDLAIDALKARADDYIEKPIDVDKVKIILEKVLEAKRRNNIADTGGLSGKIEKVKRFVELNRYKKTLLTDAASAVCLSPKYLSRVFKERCGVNFNDYRLKVKVKEAKILLKKSEFNIDRIADKLGYENTESLIRIFKKNTGYTPAQYRKKKIK